MAESNSERVADAVVSGIEKRAVTQQVLVFLVAGLAIVVSVIAIIVVMQDNQAERQANESVQSLDLRQRQDRCAGEVFSSMLASAVDYGVANGLGDQPSQVEAFARLTRARDVLKSIDDVCYNDHPSEEPLG